MRAAVILPFRDRGTDPLRKANLERVLEHWGQGSSIFIDDGIDARNWDLCPPVVVDDGCDGDAQFNRSAALNRGATVDADVLVFAEADMIVDFSQIYVAAQLAAMTPGLVIPFNEYRALMPEDSDRVRNYELDPGDARWDGIRKPAIGAVNVVSRETYELVGGYDERFEGSWYDDDAMKIAFEMCAGPTRFVNGPGYHLYHLPGWTGLHLSKEDRAATARNRMRFRRYQQAKTPEQIRALTGS